ncbi:hypothetical protein KP79_PYT13246 [Mizuhopecten yessoensis]|uniref:Mutator-like transposase domain-containing protein n=1 Tax=Mizuhopecten yessoensis TaxID=6573 RepID=A0A210Q8T9_MIZYE|nr:hypothetical protein KP79_PYT13246 [Mizuhopecten yessoensis]
MKGRYRRRKNVFTKCNTPHNEGTKTTGHGVSKVPSGNVSGTWKRLSSDMYSLVTVTCPGCSFPSTPDTEGNPGIVKLLRPKKPQPVIEVASHLHENREKRSRLDTGVQNQGNRLIDTEKIGDLMQIVSSHRCDNPDVDIHKEVKVGVTCKFKVACKTCGWGSNNQKMYKEIQSPKRGPNPAVPNLTMHASLQETSMGPAGARRLFNAMNLVPPCHSGMQRNANIAAETIITLNKEDMANKAQEVREINELRGAADPNMVNVQVDGRYNRSTITCRNKPGTSATQLALIAREDVTDKNYIIGIAVQSQICWKGKWLRRKGFDAKCPGGHIDCSATIGVETPLSEFEAAKLVGEQLYQQDLIVRYATSDGDARTVAGLDAAYKAFILMWDVKRLADPTHLGQAQFRKCMHAHFSTDMFPGMKTREGKIESQKVLSRDIKARCSLVCKELTKDCSGETKTMREKMPLVLDATLRCYSGDCSRCKRYSFVCSTGTWWNRSIFLSKYKLYSLNMNENDKHLMLEILKMKLTDEYVTAMSLGANTQRCEAFFRLLNSRLPKNVLFSRNMNARFHRAVHTGNNGVGNFLMTKIECLGATVAPEVRRSLQQIQAEQDYHQKYQKSSAFKKRTLELKAEAIQRHIQNKGARSDYKKGQLDNPPDLRTSRLSSNNDERNYHK